MKEINWRKGERLVWPDGRREREVRRHGWEVPNGSSVPREALPGGQAEDRLSLSQSVRRHSREMWCLCKRRRARGEQCLGPSVMDTLQEDPSSTFPWLQQPTTLAPHSLLLPAVQGTASYFTVPGAFSCWEEGTVGQVIAPIPVPGWPLGTAGGSQFPFHSPF